MKDKEVKVDADELIKSMLKVVLENDERINKLEEEVNELNKQIASINNHNLLSQNEFY